MRIRVLSFTTVYPTPQEPALGVFVRTRLQHLAEQTDLKVMVPVAVLNYRGRLLNLRRVVPDPGTSGATQPELLYLRWFYPPGAGAWNAIFLFLQTWHRLLQVRRRFPFQLIDAHFGHPEGVAAALLSRVLGCPFTVTLRGSEQLHGQHWLRRKWMGWAFRRAVRVITVSDRLQKFAVSLGALPSRTVTIPNGVNTEVFHPQDRGACRAEYQLGRDERVIVSVGHLIELKGHHRIIRAMPGLLNAGMNAILLIAGGRGRAGDYESVLRREVATYGLESRVRFLGHLEPAALARAVSAADILCLASSREGWPNVLHEALACGTPVVAADVGAVPEMIPSEAYGVIVPPDDVAALEAGLKQALAKSWDRQAIARWGQARSWHQVAAEVLEQMSTAVKEWDDSH
jgi:glycosyltransferase involved in cell wall biosynthesis